MSLNAWLAVLPLPQATPFAFPYETQNPDTGGRVYIRDKDDLWALIETWEHNHYLYAELVCDVRELIDKNAQRDLERYFYAKEWGVSPFPGTFDEQPASWVDKVEIIKTALMAAQNLKANRDGRK